MKSISVIIQTYNEEMNIEECIKSAGLLSDSIIVIDTESTDRTVEKAKKKDVTVYSFPFSRYVEPSRKFGIEKATNEWVFILDADERITSELAQEIKKVIEDDTYSHFKVPRKEMYAKKVWLKHGGWWPNEQYRLFKKDSFIDWPSAIHSTPSFKGQLGYLKNPLIHFSKNNLEEIVNKTIIFEDVESNLLYQAKRPVSTMIFFRKFFGELFRRLIKQQGFKDGTYGIIESFYQSFSKTITYLFLYEKYLKENRHI